MDKQTINKLLEVYYVLYLKYMTYTSYKPWYW